MYGVDLAARGEVGRLADEVDDTADRALAEQHRGGAAHDLHAREVVGVRRDAGIIGEDIAHAIAELQGVETSHVEAVDAGVAAIGIRAEEQTSELQSLMRNSYAVFF